MTSAPPAHLTQPDEPAQLTIVLGLTITDRARDYIPACDGYRPDARQHLIQLTLPAGTWVLTAAEWAEAAYVATNAPSDGIIDAQPGARAIHRALDEVPITTRALAKGDTVTTYRQTWACASAGWDLVT